MILYDCSLALKEAHYINLFCKTDLMIGKRILNLFDHQLAAIHILELRNWMIKEKLLQYECFLLGLKYRILAYPFTPAPYHFL